MFAYILLALLLVNIGQMIAFFSMPLWYRMK
jgi:hypothetical protein